MTTATVNNLKTNYVAAAENGGERLPTPDERPGTDVVVLRRQVPDVHGPGAEAAFVGLPEEAVVLVAARSEEVTRRFPDLAFERMMKEMVIVDHNGNRHWGPEAIRYLTGGCGGCGGRAVPLLPGQHGRVAAAVSLGGAESVSVQRR